MFAGHTCNVTRDRPAQCVLGNCWVLIMACKKECSKSGQGMALAMNRQMAMSSTYHRETEVGSGLDFGVQRYGITQVTGCGHLRASNMTFITQRDLWTRSK